MAHYFFMLEAIDYGDENLGNAYAQKTSNDQEHTI